MRRLAGVHEKRQGAGARAAGGLYAPALPAAAHAGHDHPALARQQQLAGLLEGVADALAERGHGARFHVQDTAGGGDVVMSHNDSCLLAGGDYTLAGAPLTALGTLKRSDVPIDCR